MQTILVLEDDAVTGALLKVVLKDYHVLYAQSAEEAMRWGDGGNQRIDLLISDLCLDGSSGVESALLLRSRWRELKVILASAYPLRMWNGQDRSALELLGTNATTILEKPYFPSVLLHKVGELIGPPDGLSNSHDQEAA